MQRYGWQARANRLKASSQASQGQSNSQNLNKNQNLAIESFSNVRANNNAPKTQRLASYNSQRDNLNLTAQRSGRITKISSLSSNPLFQDMDFVPSRNNIKKDEKVQNYKKQPIAQPTQTSQPTKNQSYSAYSLKNKNVNNKAASQRESNSQVQRKTNLEAHISTQSKSFQQTEPIEPLNLQSKSSSILSNKQAKTERPQKYDDSYTERNNAEQKLNSTSRRRPPSKVQNKQTGFFYDLLGNNNKKFRQGKNNQQIVNNQVGYKKFPQQNKKNSILHKKSFQDVQMLSESENNQNKNGSPSPIPITQNQNFKAGRQINLNKKQSNSISSVSPIINKSIQISPLKIPSQFDIQIRLPSKIIIYSLQKIYIKKLNQFFNQMSFLKQKNTNVKNKILNCTFNKFQRIFNNKKLQYYDLFLNELLKRSSKKNEINTNKINISNKKMDLNKLYIQKSANILFLILKNLWKNKLKNYMQQIKQNRNKSKHIVFPLINLMQLYNKNLMKCAIYNIKNTNIIQNLKTKSKQLCFYIEKLFIVKIRKSFNKIKQQELSIKLKKDQSRISISLPYSSQSPVRRFEQHDRANSNIQHLAFSDSKMVSNEEEYNLSSHPVRKTAKAQIGEIKNLKLQKQLKQLAKQFQKQSVNIQFRVQQMKQMISQYSFQLQYKNAKQKQLQNYLSNAPKDETNIDKSRSLIAEFLKLPSLSQLYFYILKTPQDQINISTLQNILLTSQNQPDADHEIIIEVWKIFIQNCKLKRFIQFYEENQASEDQKKANNYETLARNQNTVIKELLTNYIKQQYYWENVKSNLYRINTQCTNK